MLSIWTRLNFCRLIKDLSLMKQLQTIVFSLPMALLKLFQCIGQCSSVIRFHIFCGLIWIERYFKSTLQADKVLSVVTDKSTNVQSGLQFIVHVLFMYTYDLFVFNPMNHQFYRP